MLPCFACSIISIFSAGSRFCRRYSGFQTAQGSEFRWIIFQCVYNIIGIELAYIVVVVGCYERTLIFCREHKVRALAGQIQQIMIILVYQVVLIVNSLFQLKHQHAVTMGIGGIIVNLDISC